MTWTVNPTAGDIPITPLDGSAAAVVAFRSGGRLSLTVITKATFRFASDARASRVPPQEILRAEVQHGRDPRASIQLTPDLAPYLPRADVLFTGCAHAPGGQLVCSLPVRLAVFAGQRPLLDKRLRVQASAGFSSMPIVYERTLRGAGGVENPFGLPGDSGEATIMDPARPDQPAGFGPIGRAWPSRRRLLAATPRKALDGPIAEIPGDFDWSYFNAAPLDQRTEYLRGDEWIILEGLHPSMPRFRTCLPGARGRARVYGLAASGVSEGATLELAADTLRIDGDAELCTVVWRRSFPLPDEAALASVRVVAGVEVAGEVAVWPEPPVKAPGGAPGAPPVSAAALVGTLALSPEDQAIAAAAAALPYTSQPSAEPRLLLPRSVPGAPWSIEVAHPVPAVSEAGGLAGTLSLTDDTSQPSPWARYRFMREETPLEEAERRFRVLRRPPEPEPPPEPELIPYFEPPAAAGAEASSEAEAPEAPEPPPPAPEPSDFPIERVAAITAEIAESRTPHAKPDHRPPAEVLRVNDLTEASWGAVVRHWTDAVQAERTRGPGRLQAAYDAAYVAAVEGYRGPITCEEYARLVVAMERKESERVLADLRIQRPALMHLVRHWTRRAAADARLSKDAQAALAALRRQ